jgi:superfamily I DNA/RNA helicase
VIDEAQDLLPSVFRALLGMQAGRDDNILVLGDAAQNIYRSGFRWAHAGLAVAPGQVTHLRQCFRSTRHIVRAAAPLITSQRQRLEDDLVLPDGDAEAGPPVRVTFHAAAGEELDAVALDIAERIADGVPPSSIAVLIDDVERRRALGKRLEMLECRSEDYVKSRNDRRIDIFEQSVKLLNVASAKGIEFQLVYVPGVTEDRFPSADDDGETADRARRALYTAMTRCAWDLRLSAAGADRSGLLAELDKGCVEQREGPATDVT